MRTLLITAAFVVVGLAGCLGDDADDDLPADIADITLSAGQSIWTDPQNTPHTAYNWPTISSPVDNATGWHAPIPSNPLPGSIAGMEHLHQVADIPQGAGIAIYGSLLVVPGFGQPTQLVDISDPQNATVVGSFESQGGPHRGATIIAYPDGRIVTVISTGTILDSWDITDPTDPQPLPVMEPTGGSHKVGVVPGTPIIYNAASSGGSATTPLIGPGHLPGGGERYTEIFDLSDPMNPVLVQEFQNGYSCHHIYFWNKPSEDKFRAVCSGIEVTQIWDTKDPSNPSVIVDIPVHHGISGTPSASVPIVFFSHYSGISQDGNTLLVGDETGGGGLPPGCVAEVRTPAGSVSTPVGAVWFYDISDETNPTFSGWYSPLNDPTIKNPASSCTAHHGRMLPIPERDIVAMSFYGAGIILLDYSNPTLPLVIDQFADNSNTWETWYYDGYLFTGDLNRGADVLRIV